MANIWDLRPLTNRNDEDDPVAGYSVQAPSSVEEGRYCAYNQTRERFLSADVEAADFSTAILEDRLAAFKSGSGAALWIIPFRGLSPTSVRLPIDLVYLSESFVVLDTVESFPIFMVNSSIPLARSVLALPARSIASAGIAAGDQLILCTPDEMKRHLRELQSGRTDADAQLVRSRSSPQRLEPASPEVAGQVLQFEDRSRVRPPAERGAWVAPDPARQAQPVVAAPELPAVVGAQKAKKWWQKLLSDEPPDPRKSQREPLPGLVAYFFTGGVPAAHEVRNISTTGLYVLTSERWYVGTVVRITLTDQREPTVERSITLNAKVVRWGNDGVGFHFILQAEKGQLRNKLPAHVDPTDSASQAQLGQFLQRFRGNR